MKRYLLIFALVLVLSISIVVCASCSKKSDAPAEKAPAGTIVYLGDSIAEALIGPSPLSERDNYGYYALLGRTNNYRYYNHSVSGHKTSGSMMGEDIEGGLVAILSREEETATLMKTHIKQADIIHISIGGNNLLQYDLGLLMLEVADPEFPEKYEAGKTAENDDDKTLINLLHDGGKTTRQSLNGGDEVKFSFPNTYQDICDVVSMLREINPNAKIFFQKVYNPVFGGSKFLYSSLLTRLAEITDDGRFGAEGTKITTIEQVRLVAQELLNHLNGILDEYLENHPGAIHIIDANKAFDDYAKQDVRDGKVYYGTLQDTEGTCKGAELMFSDWTHPSNIGHAVLAATTQKKFVELGLASSDYVDVYKQIKVEQINRMYKNCAGFASAAAVAAVNGAGSFEGVTDAYFGAIKGYTPTYVSTPTPDNRKHFDTTTRYQIDFLQGSVANIKASFVSAIFDKNECYFEFTPDGRVHAQLKTKSTLIPMIDQLLSGFEFDLSTLSDMDLDETLVDPYVVEMFPGFTLDHVVESFGLMNSLGLALKIDNFEEDENIQYIVRYIEQHHGLPADAIDRLPDDFSFALTFDSVYHIETVKDADGNERQAIYIGDIVAHNKNTEPFIVLSMTQDNKGKQQIQLDVEFIMIYLYFKLVA